MLPFLVVVLASLLLITDAFISSGPTAVQLGTKLNAAYGIDTTSIVSESLNTTLINGINTDSLLDTVYPKKPVFANHPVIHSGSALSTSAYEVMATAALELSDTSAVHLIKASICGLMEASTRLFCRFSHDTSKIYFNEMSVPSSAMPRCTSLVTIAQGPLAFVDVECMAAGVVTMATTYSSETVASTFVTASFPSGQYASRDIPSFTASSLNANGVNSQLVTGSDMEIVSTEKSLVFAGANVKHTSSYVTSVVNINGHQFGAGQHFDSHPVFYKPNVLFVQAPEGTNSIQLNTGIGSGTCTIEGDIAAAVVPLNGIRIRERSQALVKSFSGGVTLYTVPLDMAGESVFTSASISYKSGSTFVPINFTIKWGDEVLATITSVVGKTSEDCVANIDWAGPLFGEKDLTVHVIGEAQTGSEASNKLWGNYFSVMIDSHA